MGIDKLVGICRHHQADPTAAGVDGLYRHLYLKHLSTISLDARGLRILMDALQIAEHGDDVAVFSLVSARLISEKLPCSAGAAKRIRRRP